MSEQPCECVICLLFDKVKAATKTVDVWVKSHRKGRTDQEEHHYFNLCDECFHLHDAINPFRLYTLFRVARGDFEFTTERATEITVIDIASDTEEENTSSQKVLKFEEVDRD